MMDTAKKHIMKKPPYMKRENNKKLLPFIRVCGKMANKMVRVSYINMKQNVSLK